MSLTAPERLSPWGRHPDASGEPHQTPTKSPPKTPGSVPLERDPLNTTNLSRTPPLAPQLHGMRHFRQAGNSPSVRYSPACHGARRWYPRPVLAHPSCFRPGLTAAKRARLWREQQATVAPSYWRVGVNRVAHCHYLVKQILAFRPFTRCSPCGTLPPGHPSTGQPENRPGRWCEGGARRLSQPCLAGGPRIVAPFWEALP